MDPTLTHGEARTVLTRTAKRIDYAIVDPDGQWRDVDGDGIKEYPFVRVGSRSVLVADLG